MSTNVDNSGTGVLPFNTSLTGMIDYRITAGLQPRFALEVTGTILKAGASVSVSATIKPYVGLRAKASSLGYKALGSGMGGALISADSCKSNHSLEVWNACVCMHVYLRMPA